VDNDHDGHGNGQAGAMGVDPLRVVQDSGGAATTEHLLRHVSRWALRESVRCGRLARAGRGVYVLPGLPAELVAAAELRGLVSHVSAAQLRRLDLVREPDGLHVTVAHGTSRRPREGTVIHRARTLDADSRRPLVTSVVRTVLDCASTLPFPEAIAVADSAVKFGLVTPDALIDAASRAHGAGHTRRLRVARTADGRAANAFESALRGVLIQAGIESFIPQFAVRAGRLVVHVDLADPLSGVALEADSFEFHGNRADFRRDCERYDELVAAGWTVLRLPWELVMFHPDSVVRLVCAAMTGARAGSSERTVPT
jgi:very-short-patch-repair endonuclease